MTIVGTDANGNALTESITGPSNDTVTTTGYFQTVTSVTASSTLGANTMDAGWTALAESKWIPTDRFAPTGPMVLAVIGGTVAYTLQQSNSNVYTDSTVHWGLLGTAGATADQAVQALDGSTAVRLTVASHTAGTVSMVVSQVGV